MQSRPPCTLPHAGRSLTQFVSPTFLSPSPLPRIPSISRISTCPRSYPTLHISSPTPPPPLPLLLPSWERDCSRQLGLVTTTYETATVEEVTVVGGGFVKIQLDTAVTATTENYTSAGQFVFIKPWGDEDGIIEPCCFTEMPGNGKLLEFIVPESSAVAEAAINGEMVEIGEVMGEGFGPVVKSDGYLEKECVVAVCEGRFCWAGVLAVWGEKRRCFVLVVGEEEGVFGKLVEEWGRECREGEVRFFEGRGDIVEGFEKLITGEKSVAVLLCGDGEVCRGVGEVVERLEEGRTVEIFVP